MTHDQYLTPRYSLRYPLRVPALLRCRGSVRRVTAELHDISVWGCGVSADGTIASGDHVFVRIAGLESWFGTARWADRNTTGIHFEWPLHHSVVELRRPALLAYAWSPSLRTDQRAQDVLNLDNYEIASRQI